MLYFSWMETKPAGFPRHAREVRADMRLLAKYGFTVGVLLGAAAAAWAIGELTIAEPLDGAQVKPGQVVRIAWRNFTTNPVDVWLKWDGHRKQIGEYSGETDGMIMWRVPADALPAYNIVVEEAGGLGSVASVNVTVIGGAPELPEVYATPNPFDLSAGRGLLTFAGAPSGSTASVFDMEGREVAKRSGSPLQWDGRDARGDLVAAGTYMFVVELPSGEKHTGKIAVVK
jgi:hypothetical protein